MKKLLAALLLTLPTISVAVDLDGYYITAKGGVSKTMDTGTMSYGIQNTILNDDDLGTGSAFGISAGKYISDNFRLELEAIKRTGYEMDTRGGNNLYEANISSKSIFINGFYDFQSFSLGSTPITPYLGGGVGISKNKMGTTYENRPNAFLDGKTISQFAYKVAAGTMVSLTENVSLDINYQYVNLGNIKSGVGVYTDPGGAYVGNINPAINGGEIKTQELMVGLQYKF
jgi:opacity protein-like surface antigen